MRRTVVMMLCLALLLLAGCASQPLPTAPPTKTETAQAPSPTPTAPLVETAVPSPTPTPTAQPTPMITPSATATATLEPTSTTMFTPSPVATATPTSIPSPTPSPTPFRYDARFDGPTCEWNVSDTPAFKSGCLESEYQILIKQASQNLYVLAANLPFADFSLSADARFASAAYGVAALIFNGTGNEFYMFTLDSSGSYGLWTHGAGWQTLVGWTSAPNFDATGANRMKVEREGSAIHLYLNDQLLTTVNDTTLIGPNLGVGVYTRSYSQPNVDVRWDNFAAYPLGETP